MIRPAWLVALACLGCGPAVGPEMQEAATSGASRPGDPSDPSDTADTADTPGPASGTSGGGGVGQYEDDDGGTGCTFTCPEPPTNTSGGGGWWCDLFEQACPEGQKCSPWSNTGEATFNDSRCVPLAPEGAQIGEPCHAEGSGYSGIDDCDLGLFCFNVDPETLEGTCVSLCEGTARAPWCEDDLACRLIDTAPFCLPSCDPLVGCAEGLGCYPQGAGFVCLLAGEETQPGAPCERVNDCSAGLFCAHADLSPGCPDDRCCVEWCDLDAPTCSAGKTSCAPLADPPPDPSWASLGFCTD
jgi:hypothetical protein